MKKVLLFTLTCVLMSAATFAQKEVKHPGEMKNATIDAYVNEAFGHLDTKKALSADLAKLEEDAKAAGVASATKEEATAMAKRAEALVAGYTKLSADVEATVGKAEAATKATTDCGMKAMKCAKAVKTATKAMTGLSKGLPAEVKRAAEVKAKVEALTQATDL